MWNLMCSFIGVAYGNDVVAKGAIPPANDCNPVAHLTRIRETFAISLPISFSVLFSTDQRSYARFMYTERCTNDVVYLSVRRDYAARVLKSFASPFDRSVFVWFSARFSSLSLLLPLSLQLHKLPLFLLARATPSCRVSILMSVIGRGSPSTLRFDLKLLSDGYSTSVGKLKLSICFYIKL